MPAGEPGEALIKGPIVTKGYHNNPQANINSFTEDGWFRTGDVLRMEGDLLYIVDRKKVSGCHLHHGDDPINSL